MKIYFGKASDQDVNVFGTDGLLEHNGDFYSGCVEFGSNPGGIEDVMIMDGCNRRLPISVDNLYEVCVILSEFSNLHGEITAAEELREYVESADNEAATCEHGHIHY